MFWSCIGTFFLFVITYSLIVSKKKKKKVDLYVWIQDHDGEVYKRKVTESPFGYTGYVNERLETRTFVCLEGGKVTGVSFLKSWKWDKDSEPNGSANKAG